MKTSSLFFSITLLFAVLFTSGFTPLYSQEISDYLTITGSIKDKKTRKNLSYVSISLDGTGIGTITNTDGTFSLKVKTSPKEVVLDISHIGYNSQKISVEEQKDNLIVYLEPNEKTLYEVIVEPVDAVELVRKAISKKGINYSDKANLLTGFYRETIKKGRNYVNISEAVIDIYKTPYIQNTDGDKVQVLKGRTLLSPKLNDTLIVKFQGGPNLSLYLDIVKNPDLLLDLSDLSNYSFKVDDYAIINEHLHYVVSFTPQVILPYALYSGKLYINRESVTVSRAEFSLSMDDRNKATQAILRKKPYKLHFKPENVSCLVTYKQYGGKTYLNYIRNEIRFKCDWKKRFFFFSTNYEIISEMVVTDKQEDNVLNIPGKLAFKANHSLSDKVSNFYDNDFWKDYNIIEPTESLESAVNKLKKQYK